MIILIPLIIFGLGFILLDKILSRFLHREDVLSSAIDAIICKITGKSIVLYVLVTYGLMLGSFWLANLLGKSNPIAGWAFAAIGFTLFGYMVSERIKL